MPGDISAIGIGRETNCREEAPESFVSVECRIWSTLGEVARGIVMLSKNKEASWPLVWRLPKRPPGADPDMIIVLPFVGGVKAYLRRFGEKPPEGRFNCPRDREQRLWRHGRYWREAFQRSAVFSIPIYRLYCPRCGHTFCLLPPFIRYHAPFGLWAHVLAGQARADGATYAQAAQVATTPEVSIVTEKTVRRWLLWVEEQAAKANVRLAQQLVTWRPGIDASGLSPPLDASYRSFRTAHHLIAALRREQRALGRSVPWGPRTWAYWALCTG